MRPFTFGPKTLTLTMGSATSFPLTEGRMACARGKGFSMHTLSDMLSSLDRMREHDARLQAIQPDPDPVDLLCYAPCPVKLVLQEAVERIALDMNSHGQAVRAHIPMGCTSIDPYDPISRQADPAKLPGLIASIGFGDFWRPDFVSRHVDAGVFQAPLPGRINPLHQRAGLIDPRGNYLVYGVTPYIFLADTRRLGATPAPRCWADLLDPRYKGEVVLCGDGDDMADAVILNVYKDFGEAGLERLSANAKGLMHSSRMAKIVGTSEPDCGAVFVIPLFFAESIKLPAHVERIWPEDGAAASPLYLLAKRDASERLAPLARFFTEGFAAIPSACWFIPASAPAAGPHEETTDTLPENASLKWVGWDFIHKQDVSALRDELSGAFRAMHKKLGRSPLSTGQG